MKYPYFSLAYRKGLSLGKHRALLILATACFLSLVAPLHAQNPKVLHIAAAADLQPVMPTLATAYEHATGIKLVTSFGSSATLAQQLVNGDPQDIFLSADSIHPQQLIAASLATGLDGSHKPTLYARGVLVLWARNDSPAQPLTLDSLTNPRVARIAIANTLHAPYGLAAAQALASLHLTGKVTPKLVVAENIAQTAQFAESGNAQAALISLTLASSPHLRQLGTFVRLPSGSYPEIRQCAVILTRSKDQAAAQNFLRWLTSPAIQQTLPRFGLDPGN
jgi:molybdate transport system substrate-binding protein